MRYTGQQWDRDSRLLYLRNRHYCAETGRFLRRDPMFEFAQLSPSRAVRGIAYGYALDNPTRFTDPSGLDVSIGYRPLEATDGLYHSYIIINGTPFGFGPEGVYSDRRRDPVIPDHPRDIWQSYKLNCDECCVSRKINKIFQHPPAYHLLNKSCYWFVGEVLRECCTQDPLFDVLPGQLPRSVRGY